MVESISRRSLSKRKSSSNNNGNIKEQKKPVKFEKILYRRQPFPDNYSGGEEQFLNELRKNVSAVKYTFADARYGALHLLCHLNVLVFNLLLFEVVQAELITWSNLATISAGLSVVLYVFFSCCLRRERLSMEAIADHARTLLTLILFGFIITPVIRTLTTSISTDTIYALAISFSVFSSIFHDYSVKAPIVSSPLSLSLGLSSTVFLISRLPSDGPAFTLLAISFLLHSYWPLLRNRMSERMPWLLELISFVLGIICVLCLNVLSPALAVFWMLFQLFTAIFCPCLLLEMQKEKRTIHGPWDEAVPVRAVVR